MTKSSRPSRGEAPAEPEIDPNNLPEGWAAVRLSEITESIRDGTHTPPKRVEQGVPLLSARNIQNGFVDFDEAYSFITRTDFEQIARTNPVNRGDVLLTIVGSLGRSCVNKLVTEFAVQRSVAIIRPKAEVVESHFLQFAFQTPDFQRFLEDSAKGTAQKGAYLGTLRDALMRAPPIAEQRRIVAKLEELLGRVSRAKARLDRVPALLKRFRQSVLAAACSGKLTADWREENPDVNSADRDRLISGLNADRKRRWVGRKGPEVIAALNNEELGELPVSWAWVTWEGILATEEHAFKRGPFGSALTKSIFVESGYKVYEQYCPINDDCSFVRYYITPEKFEELKAFAVQAGDFLISCSGVTLGRITRVPAEFEAGVINQALLRVRLNEQFVAPIFFVHVFRSEFFQSAIFENSTGSAIPNVKGVKELKSMAFPLPPFSEQQEIVRRVEKLYAIADQIEARLSKAQAQVDRLTQSILAKAFRGELVPTEAELARREGRDYEPASQLLERIREVPLSLPTPTRKRRQTRPSNPTTVE